MSSAWWLRSTWALTLLMLSVGMGARSNESITSLFKWYGDDFIAEYASLIPGSRSARERGILGAIVRFGPAPAAVRARTGSTGIGYLAYNWSLNDATR